MFSREPCAEGCSSLGSSLRSTWLSTRVSLEVRVVYSKLMIICLHEANITENKFIPLSVFGDGGEYYRRFELSFTIPISDRKQAEELVQIFSDFTAP